MNVIIEQYVKPETQTLFGGAINASVSETNASIIDMQNYMGGSLEVKENSGNGTWSFALYTSPINGGVFAPAINAAGSAITVSIPDGGGECAISDIKAKFIKWVPTLTGTSNVTAKWTPTPI